MRVARSIKGRLLWGGIAAAGIVIAAGGTAVYQFTKRDFFKQVDAAMQQRAGLLRSKVIVLWGRPILVGQPPEAGDWRDDHEQFGLFHLNVVGGKTIAKAAQLDDAAIAEFATVPNDDTIRRFVSTSGAPLRVMASHFHIVEHIPERRGGRGRDRDRDKEKDREREKERERDDEKTGALPRALATTRPGDRETNSQKSRGASGVRNRGTATTTGGRGGANQQSSMCAW